MSNLAPNPGFLIGLGSQKAGTTWLYKLLTSHPAIDFGGWKEYAFWDTYFLGSASKRKENFQERAVALAKEIQRIEDAGEKNRKEQTLQGLNLALKLMGNPERYLGHFQRIGNRPGVEVVGDFTPSYSLLSERNYAEINRRISNAGFVPKPVFIMRDPVDRMISAFNMMIRRQRRQGVDWRSSNADQDFWDFCIQPGNLLRTSYHLTVPALDAGFSAKQVKYLFFETLFQQSEVDSLTSFLGIARIRTDLGKVINASPRRYTPPEELKHKLRDELSLTYDYCRGRFDGHPALESWLDHGV